MRRMIRQAGAVLCTMSLLSASAACLPASAAVAGDTIKGAFCQSNVKDGLKDYGLAVYTYSDSLFRDPAGDYAPRLATASACLAMASAPSPHVDETHGADRDIRSFLEQIGFTDVETNADYAITPTMDTMGAACAVKTVTDADGQPCTLLAIVPRSSGYGAEWGSNFRLGSEGDAAGFSAARQRMADFVAHYAASHKLSGRLKVWIAGYSRGGAAANLLAADLIDDPAAIVGDAVELPPDQIYAYTFEAPKAADVSRAPRSDAYRRIYNIVSENDLIPLVAPAAFGFDRFGTDHVPEQHVYRGAMLGQLSYVNWRLYYSYLNYGESPEGFRRRMLGMALDGRTGTYPEAPAGTDPLPETQAEFVRLLADSFSSAVSGRDAYAQEVEPYLTELTAALVPELIDGDREVIRERASTCRYSTALLVYLYMDYELSRIPEILEKYPDQPERAELFFNKANRLALLLHVLTGELSAEESAAAQAFISNLKPEEQTWIGEVCGDFSPDAIEAAKEKTGFSAWNLSPESAAEMQALFAMYTAFMKPARTEGDTVIYESYSKENYEREATYVKARLAACYRDFMTEFLTASGVSPEVAAHQTEDTACRTMPVFAEKLLLDCPGRTDSYREDIEDAESCNKLATILGNLNNLLYAHSMDAVLAWVRAEDPDYDSFYQVPKDRLYGCRRIRIAGTDNGQEPVHITVYDSAGKTAAEFENGTMLSSADDWIRFADGRLRLPLEKAYTVKLTAPADAALSVAVEEYSTYAGEAVRTVTSDAAGDWSRLEFRPGSEYTITVPAIHDPSLEWAENSGTVYTLMQTGTPEPVPEDARPSYTMEQLGGMAVKDYERKAGIPVTAAAETDGDGMVTVRLTDAQGQLVETYRLDPAAAKGTDSQGNAVDLPQTGNREKLPALLMLLGALSAGTGAWMLRRSGICGNFQRR